MANQEHVELLCRDVEAWNAWRKAHPDQTPDLSCAGLCLAGLRRADLIGADLTDADLTQADLTGADLTKADLAGAFLAWADLTLVNLAGASLRGADLRMARLQSAYLLGADFTDVRVAWTAFADVDLALVEGLPTVKHQAPSSIGVDTLIRSGGEIPDVFLRGCGVPDFFIQYARSLIDKPFDFYSCFISYSSKDQEFAERLHADLQAKGVRCWFAPRDLPIGAKTRVVIDETIRIYDKLLLILSEHSVQSNWVEHEVEMALNKELEHGGTVLFPVRLDDSALQSKASWFEFLKTRNIGDLRLWKNHDDYQKAFDRLLRDLQAKQP